MAENKVEVEIDEDHKVELTTITDEEKKTWDHLVKEIGEEKINALPVTMVLRFIRGYAAEKEPLEATTSRLQECLKWREECFENLGVKGILENKPEGIDEWKKMWPCGVHGYGKHGHLIYVERLGQIEPKVMWEKFQIEDIQKFHVYMMEKVTMQKEKIGQRLGKQMYKHIVILDLKGFGSKHMGQKFRGPMNAMVHIDQNYYPETLYRMFIVNSPWVFKMLWAIVRPWVHPVTQTRIKMGKAKMDEYIEADQIPEFIDGGACTKCEGKCLEVPFGEDHVE